MLGMRPPKHIRHPGVDQFGSMVLEVSQKLRIQNKTYGICRNTGKLIPAERLRAVPHTTMSMEAKLKQN
jgi:RNA polymerase-binding transcription factor DksA